MSLPLIQQFHCMFLVAYQMMFAIITPALITGAFANRVKFTAYLAFLSAAVGLFPPFVRDLGRRILAMGKVKDFAYNVVHNIAGFAALASVLYVGKWKIADPGLHMCRS